ncbi:DUF2283 domain-containing protein [Microcella sp.]|uniref:DUF2283 domain-containing protein n=1 Tax=Microcella sp. TaxID=1913979 RepID=UPI0025681D9B|nr:DUF2283 domain-containing protein [Microcella sp.]MBX9472845.1 DUF2283 domain-containing protein [Microcella sp.]
MKIIYDPVADAAYIYLQSDPNQYSHMVALDPQAAGGMINFDYDTEGLLLGIEVLGAKRLLHPDLLSEGLESGAAVVE